MAYVTIRDVAYEAGVSIAAVSQILHGKGRFSQETRRHVQDTARKMGYVPDRRAQLMRSSQTKTVGLLVPDLRNPYFADLVAFIEDALYEYGVTTLIGAYAENLDRQDAFIANLLAQRIDGALVVPQGSHTPGISLLTERKLPVVFVDRRVPDVNSVPCVVSDPEPGIRDALVELRKLGHRRIGYVAHPVLGSVSINERELALRALADDLHADGTIIYTACDSSYASYHEAVRRFIDQKVTAIIFAYSPDAISIIGQLHNQGIAVGRDISIVSFDDIMTFRLMTPRVSVISQQVEKMGQKGIDILLESIESQTFLGDDVFKIPTTFIQRDSVNHVEASQ